GARSTESGPRRRRGPPPPARTFGFPPPPRCYEPPIGRFGMGATNPQTALSNCSKLHRIYGNSEPASQVYSRLSDTPVDRLARPARHGAGAPPNPHPRA